MSYGKIPQKQQPPRLNILPAASKWGSSKQLTKSQTHPFDQAQGNAIHNWENQHPQKFDKTPKTNKLRRN